MPDLAYLSAVFMGSVALLVEAYRQYRKPIPDYLSPDKSPVDPATLATPGGYMRGLAFYALCYLVLYFALLSSALLRSLWLATDPTQTVAGAQSFLDNDEARAILGERGTTTPLYISTALIAALGLGFGQQFESILRTIAYWLAGIPRGFYYVVDNLRAYDYGKDENDGGNDRKGPLSQAYESGVGRLGGPANGAEFDLMRSNARASDTLAYSILDRDGERWWPRASLQDFKDEIDPLHERQKTVAARLGAAASTADVVAAGAELRSLRASFEDAFAQLYIRSGSRTTIPPPGSKTRPIILYLQKKGLGFSAVSAEAALIAFMIAVPLYFGIDALYRALAAADFHLTGITWERLIRTNVAGGFATALASCARYSIFIWIASALASVFQANLSAMGAWRRGKDLPVRFLQIFGWSLVPAIVATVAFFVAALASVAIDLFVRRGVVITKTQVAEFVRGAPAFYLGCFGLACLIAFFTLRTIDHRKDRNRPAAITSGVLFAGLWLVYAGVLVLGTYAPLEFPPPAAVEPYEAIAGAVGGAADPLAESAFRAAKEVLLISLPACIFFYSFATLMSQEHRKK